MHLDFKTIFDGQLGHLLLGCCLESPGTRPWVKNGSWRSCDGDFNDELLGRRCVYVTFDIDIFCISIKVCNIFSRTLQFFPIYAFVLSPMSCRACLGK